MLLRACSFCTASSQAAPASREAAAAWAAYGLWEQYFPAMGWQGCQGNNGGWAKGALREEKGGLTGWKFVYIVVLFAEGGCKIAVPLQRGFGPFPPFPPIHALVSGAESTVKSVAISPGLPLTSIYFWLGPPAPPFCCPEMRLLDLCT